MQAVPSLLEQRQYVILFRHWRDPPEPGGTLHVCAEKLLLQVAADDAQQHTFIRPRLYGCFSSILLFGPP